jgi:hypothetical protein
MAVRAKYTAQMPFVGTEFQKSLILRISEEGDLSQADVARAGLNTLFGLVDEEALPAGVTEDELVERMIALVKRTGGLVQPEGAVI